MSYVSEDDFRYIAELGAGNFGICKLLQHRDGEYVACKYLPRLKVDENVEREVMIHSTLHHPNIVGFKSVFCTDQHLVIVMEYAAGGELFDRVKIAGHFTEDEARYFFQQLISGVEYCHFKGVAHRDLKLENTLLDGSAAPLLKIADFGHTPPKSTVGTPAYIGPEVLMKTQYDGAAADVWSCGVHLYVMLVGAYPFDDPRDGRNLKKTISNILAARYAFPSNLELSPQCKELLRKILVVDPRRRITIAQIKEHPWYLWNLPNELKDGCKGLKCYPKTTQAPEDVVNTIRLARSTPPQQQQHQPQAGSHSV